MTNPKDPNATVAFDLVSAPEASTESKQSVDQEPTAELAMIESTDKPKQPIDKEKLKTAGIGASVGAIVGGAATAVGMTYGADAIHHMEAAGTSALHSVENVLGIDHALDQPVSANGPAADPNTPAQAAEHNPPAQHATATHHEQAQPVAHQDAPQDVPQDQPAPAVDNQADTQHQLVDLDHDGQADALIVDDNGTPEMIIDMNHDGQADGIVVDTDHDGQFDQAFLDTDHDGFADQATIDLNHDGTADAVVVDSDGDHGLDTFYADTNGDGQISAADDHQATGDDQVVAFTDHGGGDLGVDHQQDIAQNDHPAADDYNPNGDVHEWAA